MKQKWFTWRNRSKWIDEKKPKKLTTLNYIEISLILASAITECISISAFAPLLGISTETTISVTGLKICAITAETKKYKSIIKK